MIKIWGRNTSSNVQKVMWAVGEMALPHRAHRRRRAVRQEQGAALSGDEPQRAGADAGGGGRLHAVGIELDRALSRGQARPPARSSPPTCRTRALRRTNGWTGSSRSSGPAITPVFWGLIRTPPEKRDADRDRGRQGQDHRGGADPRRASSARPRIVAGDALLLRRHPGRHHDLSLSCSSFRSGRRRRHLDRWYAAISIAPGVQGAGRSVPLT